VKKITEPSGPAVISMVELVSEGFEEEWVADDDGDSYLVPPGWDVDGICISSQSPTSPGLTHYWSQFEPADHPSSYPFPHTGRYCAGLWWSNGYGEPHGDDQDEWLITPELFVSNCVDLELEFYSVYWMRGHGCIPHTYVKASTDGGVSWDTVACLQNDEFYFPGATGGPAGTGWNWNEYPIEIDLSAYDGSSSLMIAFHYARSVGLWMVDDVVLQGVVMEWPLGTYHVEAVVMNYGTFNESNFNVNATIFEVTDTGDKVFYQDNVMVTATMCPGDDAT
ncbi:unnamed protein product, partial [marine sediment metagenome]